MISSSLKISKNEAMAPDTRERADYLFQQQKDAISKRTDKLFAGLFILQWLGAIAWSLLSSPTSWEGSKSYVHIHVYQSFLLGLIIISFPLFLIYKKPGSVLTRQVVASAQMLSSGLLIAASGGRIETHFHVFGSLAFLAFYRDWRPLLTASIVTMLDHIIRGIYAPATIYGVAFPEPWRWVEHTAWVVFCDIFLAVSIRYSIKDMKHMSRRQAELETAKNSTEQEVIARTAELKQSEQNLKDSEATLRAIFETAADSIVTISENGSIESANQTCEKMFAYSFHQIFGKHVSLLITSIAGENCDIESWQKLMDSAKFGKDAQRLEGNGNSLKRGSFPIEISLSLLELKGRKLVTAIIRDISERKEAEKRVSEFYSIVSHELRTPLTSIRGSLGLVEGGLTGELSEETEELIGIARESCDRLIRLINDILDLKKLETGKFEFHKTEFKPADLFNMALSGTRGMAAERSVRLEIAELSEELVYADIDRLNQVLVNLLSNAVKFSERSSRVELSAISSGGMIRFAVRDYGKGIPRNEQHKLFKKFQQLDSSDHRAQEGTGLGLSICKAIIDQHGGVIGVESQDGAGSTFWFELPLAGRSEAELEAELEAEAAPVLLIESDYSTARTVKHHLESHGIACTEASNLREALLKIAQNPPLLIILDPETADFDLAEFMAHLKVFSGKSISVLAYRFKELSSIEKEQIDIDKSDLQGITRFLTKSVASHEDLLNTVDELLLHIRNCDADLNSAAEKAEQEE